MNFKVTHRSRSLVEANPVLLQAKQTLAEDCPSCVLYVSSPQMVQEDVFAPEGE